MTSRYCKICKQFHDLSNDWPEACLGHFVSYNRGPQIIRDIQPYQAVAVDIATGKPPRIGSRSEHREFLKRNHYVEVGNERIKPRQIDYGDIHPKEIARTIQQLKDRR